MPDHLIKFALVSALVWAFYRWSEHMHDCTQMATTRKINYWLIPAVGCITFVCSIIAYLCLGYALACRFASVVEHIVCHARIFWVGLVLTAIILSIPTTMLCLQLGEKFAKLLPTRLLVGAASKRLTAAVVWLRGNKQ